MSSAEAGARWASTLSFARGFFRKITREKWQVERLSMELDADGRGEALYKLAHDQWIFHCLIVSDMFEDGIKVDRSFGVNWDVSAILVQGEWTPERREALRVQVPKQYEGRFDADTLCFTRGNRSERIFEYVVSSLAEGRQPDPATISPVGYIFRTTAFAGNGLFGTTPFSSLPAGHPLAPSYYLQIAAAFMLREFVFDLVDHLASARSNRAVRLDDRLKRYLGIGNSAGLGLIPFSAQHPHIVHRWCLTAETARAAARRRRPDASDDAGRHFLSLLVKAIRYFHEDRCEGQDIFLDSARIATELTLFKERFEQGGGGDSWGELVDRLAAGMQPETVNIVHGILIEIYQDIIDHADETFNIDESYDIVPAMPLAELRTLIEQAYSWALAGDPAKLEADTALFWYFASEAQDEPRRGWRGRAPLYEFESKMDIPLRVNQIHAAILERPGDETTAEFLATRPDLRSAVRRIQSVASLEYAELRINALATSFLPFANERFVLAFYGMEKFDPRHPRAVKGALLQGAPIAADVASGREGDWPFPLRPAFDEITTGNEPPAAARWRAAESPEVAISKIKESPNVERTFTAPDGGDPVIFPVELRKLLVKALQFDGHSLGISEDIYQLVEFSETLAPGALGPFIGKLGRGGVAPRLPLLSWRGDTSILDLSGGDALNAAPAALDLACMRASGPASRGLCLVKGAHSAWAMEGLAHHAARRGLSAAVSWRDPADPALPLRLALASPGGSNGPWLAVASGDETLPDGIGDIIGMKGETVDGLRLEDGTAVSILCWSFRLDAAELPPGRFKVFAAADMKEASRATGRSGFRITADELKALYMLSKRTLVPDNIEPLLAEHGD